MVNIPLSTLRGLATAHIPYHEANSDGNGPRLERNQYANSVRTRQLGWLTGINQMYVVESPNSAETLAPMFAMTGIGQNDKP